MTEKKRYYDIDWLRVIGMLLIFSFHNARFFNEEDWHVKNFQLDFGMSVYVAVLNQFIMPLFFILSAIAIYYALKRRPGTEFMRERVSRLLVPLIFGIFTHIPFQVYIERVTHGDFTGTFWQFHPALLRRLVWFRRQLRLDGPAPVVPADAVPVFMDAAAPFPAYPEMPSLSPRAWPTSFPNP